MKKPAILIGIIILVGILIFTLLDKKNIIKPTDVGCTDEAMVCPDGTAVGRTGPQCEFAACPTVPAKITELSGHLCYSYTQNDAPYKVQEYVDINVNNGIIKGTKQGTQVGPNMSNGYEGTLTGMISNNVMDVVFDYVVEGSHNKEQEIYKVADTELVKQRYQLIDKNKMLVPDITKLVSELHYKKIDCKI